MLEGVLPPALVSLLLAISGVSAVPYNFKDNYRDPTPSPEDGPPASFHASRNRNILPYEISGIVGAYVFTVLLWGILLLTVGRKMRRKALESPRRFEQELQNKSIWDHEVASPTLSTRSATSWTNRFRESDSGVSSTPQTPVISSPTSFDPKVIDAQRDQARAEMERLYAAVMDHDAQKHLSQSSMGERENSTSRNSAVSRERRRPSAIIVARSRSPAPDSPVKTVYPANNQAESSSATPPRPPPLTRLRASDKAPPPSPRSILSKLSQASSTASSSRKSARFNLKNLRISSPIQKYPGESSCDEGRMPLSPPSCHPGVPPSPPTQTTTPISPYETERAEALDTVQPLPRPAPQRNNRLNLTISPPAPPPPPPQTQAQLQPQHPHKQSQQPPSSLPLRSFAQPLASPSIQTTVLSRRMEALSLGTPKTGVPFTPYSPYMPFTPITPVTPSHLVSRRDRKREGKKAARETEMVQSPKEIFGDAW